MTDAGKRSRLIQTTAIWDNSKNEGGNRVANDLREPRGVFNEGLAPPTHMAPLLLRYWNFSVRAYGTGEGTKLKINRSDLRGHGHAASCARLESRSGENPEGGGRISAWRGGIRKFCSEARRYIVINWREKMRGAGIDSGEKKGVGGG